MLRSLYSCCSENQELSQLEHATNTAEFIKILESFSIKKKKAARGAKKRSKRLEFPEVGGIPPPAETVIPFEQEIIKDKKIGM